MKLTFKQFMTESYLAKPFTKAEAKEIFVFLTNGIDPSDKAEYKLYDYLESEMPYGTKKARDSTPHEFYADYFSDMSEDEIQDWIDKRTEKKQMKLSDKNINEILKIRELNSDAMHSKKAIDNVKAITSKKETVIAGDKEYKIIRSVAHTDLAKGMVVLASYRSTNQGAQVYEILGFTDDTEVYGNGGVKFSSVKDLLKAKGVNTLKDLNKLQNKNEYGYHSYMVAKDLDDKDQGPWFYLYNGFWSRGSGAEKCSFWLLEEI